MHSQIKRVFTNGKPQWRGTYTRIKRAILNFNLSEPFSTGIFEGTIPADNKVETHCHKRGTEIFLVYDPCIFIIDGQVFELQKNNIIVIQPYEFHEIIPKESDCHFLAIRMPYEEDDKFQPSEELD